MIRVLHLYYDLLNLYGEQGNILALKRAFKNQNVEIEVDYLSVQDKIDFKKYDLVYLGSGSTENLLIALEDIKRHKKELKKYIESKKVLLATGNSYLLFGQKINNLDALGIFDYYAASSEKMAHESLMELYQEKDVIGFQNREFMVNNKKNHLFKVKEGLCDNLKSEYEGYHEYNFYGTFVIGPLLIRNPHFTNILVKEIMEKNNLIYHEYEDKILVDAYNQYIKNFY